MNPQKMIALEEGHSVEAGIPPCAIRPEKRTAIFGEDHVYRYTLDIVWDESLPLCQVIGLNPSTADEFKVDPTVRRCKDFARRFGCGGIVKPILIHMLREHPDWSVMFERRELKPRSLKRRVIVEEFAKAKL